MKAINYLLLLLLVSTMHSSAQAQTLNWRNFSSSQRHVLNLNAGIENGSIAGIGYAHRLGKTFWLLNADYSMPFGGQPFDDFKVRGGAQWAGLQTGNLIATLKARGVFRRYGNNLVRMLNFGSEFSGTVGFYGPKWFAAAEAGFDKAIVTHIQHSDAYKQVYKEAQSGWYIPTGGYGLYGLQGGYSFGSTDVYGKAGLTLFQDFKTAPAVPFYFGVGCSVKW